VQLPEAFLAVPTATRLRVSRQIRTLSRNHLWRDTLRAIEGVTPGLRGDPLVREAIGGFFWARGCPAHAADGYGRRAGLSSSAKLVRRLARIASGGPLKGLPAGCCAVIAA